MNFRENLIHFRKAKYPSARKFAQALGIPYNTYLSYENPAKPTEPRYEMLIKIAALLDVTTDELLGYVNVDAAAERFKHYIEATSYFKVEVLKNGEYAIVLKTLPVPNDVKTFSKEEFVEVIHSLVGKALEYTSAEQQVLKNNIDFIFSYFLDNYLKFDLIAERPHDFNLLVKDFPKVYKTLAELYPEKNFDDDSK